MRKLALLVLGIGVLLCCSALAFAADKPAAKPAPAATVILAKDPFLSPDVQTRVPMVPRCPCDVFMNCAYMPVGYDCASPAYCCSCQGVNPALRMCVGIPG